MSLLMKALEKAAKDRGQGSAGSPKSEAVTAAPLVQDAATLGEIALDIAAEPARPRRHVDFDSTPAEPEASRPADPPVPAAPTRAAEVTARPEEQERAADILATVAAAAVLPEVPSSRRQRPMVIMAIIAGIIALAFAVYVYLQITNPGMFRQAPPPALVKGPPPAAPAPKPVPPAPAAAAATPVTGADSIPAAPGPGSIPTANVLAKPAPAAATKSAAPDSLAPAARSAPTVAAPPSRPAVAEARPAPVIPSGISVRRGKAPAKADTRIEQAYADLQAGRIDQARAQYDALVAADPRNVNALLASASIATQQGRHDDATRTYLKVLELEPRNAYAQAGLIGFVGRADPASAEGRLKELIAREPSAFLYFTLGNLYGDQNRWPEAQQAHFQAYHRDSSNPDYAYNLAVALEHVGQQKLAAGFYQAAVELAAARGYADFDTALVQARINQLTRAPR